MEDKIKQYHNIIKNFNNQIHELKKDKYKNIISDNDNNLEEDNILINNETISLLASNSNNK